MARSIPVPWVRWQRFRVWGVVCAQDTKRPIADLRVQAFDKDIISDDFLGDCSTDEEGRFEIRFTDVDFKDALESQPDIYLVVLSPDNGRAIHDTSHAIRRNASDEEYYEILIPTEDLPQIHQ